VAEEVDAVCAYVVCIFYDGLLGGRWPDVCGSQRGRKKLLTVVPDGGMGRPVGLLVTPRSHGEAEP
jgi:hypothetical protein